MKQDRFLVGILVGIGVLVIVALTLFFTRQDKQEYVPDDTPEGVVHDYVLAIYKDDYEKAYAYLAETDNMPSYNEFRQAFFNNYVNPNNAGLELGETKIVGEEAYVTVYLIYNPSGPFSDGSRSSDTAHLERQNGAWKLLQMPYNFWSYNWYQPTVEAAPAPK
jgi:hypothetical protein